MVFITCRVHPGESPASYVCQGSHTSTCYTTNLQHSIVECFSLSQQWSPYFLFTSKGVIDYLLSDDPGAKLLRDNIIFKIG